MGVPVETKRFACITGTNGAINYLRREGCRFGNHILSNLNDESILLTTLEYEYEVEVLPYGIGAERRRRSGGKIQNKG